MADPVPGAGREIREVRGNLLATEVAGVIDAGCECEPSMRRCMESAPWGGLCPGLGRKIHQAMKNHSNAKGQVAPVSGFHAGGRDAYHREAGTGDRMIREEAKLHRRIKLSCKPQGIVGDIILILRRRRLVLKLRRRFRKPQALFIANHMVESSAAVSSKPAPGPDARMDTR